MKVADVKELIKDLELEPEVRQKVDSYLAGFDDGVELPKENQDKIMELLDLVAETNEIMAEAYEKTADELDKYMTDVGKAVDEASQKIEETKNDQE